MKRFIVATLALSLLALSLYLIPPEYLDLIVVVIISLVLIASHAVVFTVGARWTKITMQTGAWLAIESAGRNDEHDARKIQSLAQLTREAIKIRPQPDDLPGSNGYPALPPTFTDGQFTITGLDEEL